MPSTDEAIKETGTRIYCGESHKNVQPLRKKIWQLLGRTKLSASNSTPRYTQEKRNIQIKI